MNFKSDFQLRGRSFPHARARPTVIGIYSVKPTAPGTSHVVDMPQQNKGKEINRMRRKKMRQNPVENNVKSTFNIPGLEKIIHSPNYVQKIVWGFLVLALYGLCIYQLVDRVALYLEAPIVVDVTVEKMSSIEFPAVTICPPFGTTIFQQKRCRNNSNAKNVRLSLSKMWDEYRIQHHLVNAWSSCRKTDHQFKENSNNNNDTCGLTITLDFYQTFWGACLRITSATKLIYLGAWTFIKFTVDRDKNPSPPRSCQVEWKLEKLQNETVFIPHARDIFPTDELGKLFFRVKTGVEATVRFKFQQFKYLNTKKNPCVSQIEADECKRSCLENRLTETVPCRLPYMVNSTLKFCTSGMDGKKAQDAVGNVYRKFDNCNCSRPCNETVMSFIPDYHKVDHHSTPVFSLNYPDNAEQIVTERYAYSFSALVSDIGGSLGFCVGICLFNFIELVFSTLQVIINCFRKKLTNHAVRPIF